MAIFLTEASKVIVQGMTGSEGTQAHRPDARRRHADRGRRQPAQGRHSQTFPLGDGTVDIPVFGTVAEAMAATGADVSVVFVPPAFTKAAVMEAIDAGMPLIVIITEGIAGARHRRVLHRRAGGRGAGSSARTAPASSAPGSPTSASCPPTSPGPGRIGLVSKSGTLTYQMMYELRDFGFSTCVGIGGDPIIGTTHIDALAAFEADPRPTRS